MTSIINLFLLYALLSGAAHAQDVSYVEDGPYRVLASKHLINDVFYKKGNMYQTVVEIPTGSRDKWEVDHKTGHLEWEFKKKKPRKVKFLAYPGNYGFIPQTLSGDNDPLDIIVLSESSGMGDVLAVKVIGMIKLLDKGEADNKVIAVDPHGPFKDVDDLKDMLLKNPNVIPIVKQWFEGYKDPGKIVFLGYSNKKKTIKYIESAHKYWAEMTRY